jgi:hypothetical protein
LGHGCVSAFFCVVLSCVGRGLALDSFPNQGVLLNVYRIEKSIKEGQGPQMTVESHRKKNEHPNRTPELKNMSKNRNMERAGNEAVVCHLTTLQSLGNPVKKLHAGS